MKTLKKVIAVLAVLFWVAAYFAIFVIPVVVKYGVVLYCWSFLFIVLLIGFAAFCLLILCWALAQLSEQE